MGGRIEFNADAYLAEIRQRLGSGADRMESKGLRAAGQPIAEAQRSHINRSNRSGIHAQDDIKVSNVRRKDGQKYVLIGAGKKTSWRGHFREFGTSKMSPQPWAQPGFEEGKGAALQILIEEFRRGLGQK